MPKFIAFFLAEAGINLVLAKIAAYVIASYAASMSFTKMPMSAETTDMP